MRPISFLCFIVLACGLAAGCPSTGAQAGASTCHECVSSTDCGGGELCVMLNPASVCTLPCSTDSDCASVDQCVALVTDDGQHVSTCIARNNTCGTVQQSSDGTDGGPATKPDGGSTTKPDGGSTTKPDAGSTTKPDAGSTTTIPCSDYVAPTTAAACSCQSGHTCTANGCYEGDYCQINNGTPWCTALPESCGGPPPLTDALNSGGPVTSSIDPHNGGTTDRLLFTVVGDTRPATVNDTANYPTAIINGIYGKMATLSPQPPFSIGTGDYEYADPSSGTSSAQLALYMTARKLYSGIFWPAMGNHECDGSTTSNCMPGDSTSSENIGNFISQMLTPIGETNPYYVRNVNATNGSWTAKFIFLAPNSWTSAEATFLSTELARSTTYTFVIRHEPSAADSGGGTAAPAATATIDAACKGQPITLMIEGHSHTWYFFDYTDSTYTTQEFPKEAIVGNGGAPMTTTSALGYTVIAQRAADNAIIVSGYDYTTGLPVKTYALTANGTEIQYQ